MSYPTLPNLLDLVVDDQGDAAVRLGMLLASLPNDHAAVVAARLALELRDAARAQKETAAQVATDPSWEGYSFRSHLNAGLPARRAQLGPMAAERRAA